ncbi:MAG: hypothetical protein U0805_00150 [Pirellulales bacterium]
MYVSAHPHQDHHVSYAWLFRNCGRLGGVIVMAFWVLLVANEMKRTGSPAPDAYLQAGALAIVFAGYFVGWRKEKLGGVLAIAGTVVFFIVHTATFGVLPMPAASLLAAPGAFYLMARRMEAEPTIEAAETNEH